MSNFCRKRSLLLKNTNFSLLISLFGFGISHYTVCGLLVRTVDNFNKEKKIVISVQHEPMNCSIHDG